MEQGRDRGGRGPDRRGFDRRLGFDHRQDKPSLASDRTSTSSTLSSERSSATARGRFARPDQLHRSFLPNVQCEACKRIGHEAINCDMLALALFIERHKQSLSDAKHDEIESMAHALEGAPWSNCPNPASGNAHVLRCNEHHCGYT